MCVERGLSPASSWSGSQWFLATHQWQQGGRPLSKAVAQTRSKWVTGNNLACRSAFPATYLCFWDAEVTAWKRKLNYFSASRKIKRALCLFLTKQRRNSWKKEHEKGKRDMSISESSLPCKSVAQALKSDKVQMANGRHSTCVPAPEPLWGLSTSEPLQMQQSTRNTIATILITMLKFLILKLLPKGWLLGRRVHPTRNSCKA